MMTHLYPFSGLIGLSIATYGFKKGSLSLSGAFTAFLVGYLTLANPLKLFGICLLVFYLTGSRATKVKAKVKSTLDESAAHSLTGGRRDAIQVLCNSLLGTISALTWRFYFQSSFQPAQTCAVDKSHLDGNLSRALLFTAVAFFSVCAGDTFSSELGILSAQPPILVTTLRSVPKGTNGGISPLGLAASVAGGFLIGLTAAISLFIDNPVCGCRPILVIIGATSGLTGSLVDSLLGATLQQTLYSKTRKMVVQTPLPDEEVQYVSGFPFLSNNQVNILSSSGVSIVVGYLSMFFSL